MGPQRDFRSQHDHADLAAESHNPGLIPAGRSWCVLSVPPPQRQQQGGLFGGFVFAFNPWHVEQAMHHAHVASIEFLPVFVLSYLLALERKNLKWLGLAKLLYTLSVLCCWYFLFYGLYFLIFDSWVRLWRFGPADRLCAAKFLLGPAGLPWTPDRLRYRVAPIGTDTGKPPGL